MHSPKRNYKFHETYRDTLGYSCKCVSVAVAKGSALISKLFQYFEKCENKQIRCDFSNALLTLQKLRVLLAA